MISDKQITAEQLVEAADTATRKAFEGKFNNEEINDFLESIRGVNAPAPIAATGSIIFVGIFGEVVCEPMDKPYIFKQKSWGVGAAGVSSVGLLYTAYDNWNGLWKNTTSYHAQGIAKAGGIFQINFFNKKGIPIGQYNGPAIGIALFEVGGAGKWKKK